MIVACRYFTGSRDHTIKVWDASFRCRQTIQAHTDSVTSLVVCGEHLFSSSRENRIKKWHIDLDDAEGVPVTKVKSFRAHNDWVCGKHTRSSSRRRLPIPSSQDQPEWCLSTARLRLWGCTQQWHCRAARPGRQRCFQPLGTALCACGTVRYAHNS
jgi:WD40 repeat protein